MINNINSYGYNNGVVITAPLFFKEVLLMKKFISMLIVTVFALCAFAGCGNNNALSEMGSDVSEIASDAVSGMESMGDAASDGTVSDTDGIIGNETTSGNTDPTASTEDNTHKQTNTAPTGTLI